MIVRRFVVNRALLVALGWVALGFSNPAASWHHPLYLDGGNHWRARLPITIENEADEPAEGVPIEIMVGNAPGEADIAGVDAQSLRVCTEQGAELLFDVLGPDGEPWRKGGLPEGAKLILPAECPPKDSTLCYVYFDNPSAGELPDYLAARRGVINGGFELGQPQSGSNVAPPGWRHDAPDDTHRAIWTTDRPQSGDRCVKTIVAKGAEPSWISTRQHNIRIEPGARYRMTAWVRAENVQGFAGWYIHVGNRDDSMLISPMLNGGEGTYDWKEVSAEFTAPAEADRADLGTVLRGTGTAWFDNVTLECLDPLSCHATPGEIERISIQELGREKAWPGGSPAAPSARRALARVWNLTDSPTDGLVAILVDRLHHRLGGRLDPSQIRVFLGDQEQSYRAVEGRLLVPVTLPARSAATFQIHFAPTDAATTWSTDADEYAALVRSPANLLADADFEESDARDTWTLTSAEEAGVTIDHDSIHAPGLGSRAARLAVPHDAQKGWRGRRQSVPVRPGATYLVAAWLRCEDLRNGSARLHLHIHTGNGSLSQHNPMRSTGQGIQGTEGWTLICGTFTMPPDAAELSLHLTTDGTGTVWHDGALVTEIRPASIVALESPPLAPDALEVWPVNSLVKLFPDEPPPAEAAPAAVELAGGEYEPLQLAVRAGRRIETLRVEVEPPQAPGGARLPAPEVNVVGYVPIDYATNYYRSTAPDWHRKTPQSSPACDGFPGRWPDPLLPTDMLDLPAHETHAVWATFFAPPGAAPGEYRGVVRVEECLPGDTRRKTLLAEVPYTLHVWDFTLPETSQLKAIYDVRLGPGADVWGRSGLDDWYRDLVSFMARYRLTPDTVRPAPSFRVEDGQVTADFTAFDEAATWYFDELNLPHSYTPWHFYLFGWGHPPKSYSGEPPYPGKWPYEDADRTQLRPEFKRLYQQALRLFWDHLEEKGWDDRFVLYISDEPFFRQPHIIDQMKALCEMIHEVDPAIPIYSSTWHHVPEWDDALDVWGIGHYGVVSADQMNRLQSQGKRIWFTTDGQMCTDTPYCAIERLLPYYCFRYGAEAYEFWGFSWTTYDPYRFGWHAFIRQSGEPGEHYWVRYPNGDGFLAYPGKPIGHEGPVASIRLAQARDGVEDFEYLSLLQDRIDRAKSRGRDVAQAQAALNRALELVSIPTPGGRYSTKILPEPEALPRVRSAIAQAIESLPSQ